MSESPNKKKFVENLLAQDPPSADKQLRHKEVLFEKVERRIWLGKIIGGAIYIALFSVAFWAYMQRQNTENLVHSICWGAVSLHILLWFLIYFQRTIYRALAEIVEKNPDIDKQPWKNQDMFITIIAVLIFVFSTIILYRSFLLTDPLKAAHLAASIFWATVFFLFWYPFVTASLLAKLWLEYKKMELNITKTYGEEA
jgi:magnesium-transporting ATPase (P-type)